MRTLSSSAPVNAPASFALAYVNTYFLQRGPHGEAKLALRFALPNLFVSGLTIEKIVMLRLDSGALIAGTKELALSWDPLGTRAVPSFTGRIVAYEDGPERSRLAIEGRYQPPGGPVGVLFDAVLGVRISRATLVALLAQLAAGIDADYALRVTS